ncbi:MULTISPECIES: hypothetical protein [unclassified Pseudomonas]|uniref:hypothetical protein n=1 Tax=unclassified Pseudomonas TaxID=196821 RepID=UPI002AC910E3|nr:MULTISPECIES: hypothetical protein [unclassified Pseudomonas]MEB0043076.1 hypothetical protein [Pseudomonas sp. MH10]MEB0121467.1 hypothetical protein [Pseudomonas sp. CCI1.2]WPX64066.1 hypothetical protein RHM59_24995 [Pseudomonas sp. MH10]
MVSISDLGKPDTDKDIPDTPENRAKAVADFMARHEHDELGQIAAAIAVRTPTMLGSYQLGLQSRLPIIEIPPNPAIALMREQAAHARRVEKLANRPWWKGSGAWALVIAILAFALPLITEHPAQLVPDTWIALKAFVMGYIH